MKPRIGDEKLALISVGSTIGHRQQASPVMLESVNKLILEWLPIDALPALARSGGVPSLDDEACLDSELPLMLRWNKVSSYLLLAARPRKFRQVRGHSSQKSSTLMAPWVVWRVTDIYNRVVDDCLIIGIKA